MKDAKSTLDNFIGRFLYSARKDSIHDWQGTTDYSGNRVLRMDMVRLEFGLEGYNNIDLLQSLTQCDMPWAEDHFLERLEGPTNPGKTYKYWPYHKNIEGQPKSKLNPKIFSHTYQERFWPKCQKNRDERFKYGNFNSLIDLLKNNPKTRQAYLPIWHPQDIALANLSERVPCSLGYYFYIDEHQLNCAYTIRSCDIYKHFRNDIYLTARLMLHICSEIPNINMGKLYMDIYNAHLFEVDIYAFKKRENNAQSI